MCTVTWLFTADGYQLFSNRDESRARPPAQPPRAVRQGDSRYLAPVDGEAGGSWITVNEHGLSLCLLNYYHAELSGAAARPDGRPFRSRGLLVTDLAAQPAGLDLRRALEALDLTAYRPFTLLALEPPAKRHGQGGELLVEWDGERFSRRDASSAQPLISSGYDFTGATRHRRATFEALLRGGAEAPRTRPNAAELLLYHRDHRPEPGPYSVCMHRPDARTVSLTRVTVSPEEITMSYASGPPCRTPLGGPLGLRRATSAASR